MEDSEIRQRYERLAGPSGVRFCLGYGSIVGGFVGLAYCGLGYTGGWFTTVDAPVLFVWLATVAYLIVGWTWGAFFRGWLLTVLDEERYRRTRRWGVVWYCVRLGFCVWALPAVLHVGVFRPWALGSPLWEQPWVSAISEWGLELGFHTMLGAFSFGTFSWLRLKAAFESCAVSVDAESGATRSTEP